MRLLLLPSYFYPEKAASYYLFDNLFEEIARQDIYMNVYTPLPCRGVSAETKERYKSIKHEWKYDKHMEIHRFRMFSEGINPILRFVRYFLISIIQLWKGVFSDKVDLIYVASTPPTQGALAALIKKIKGIPFVYNLQDIFPDSLVGTGLAKKNGILWKMGRIIENFTYRNADKIIVISEDFKKNIIAKGVPEDKIEVVYNWVEEKTIFPVEKKDNPLFEEFGISRDLFTVVYAGNLGNAQNIKIILEGAMQLPEVQFAIFGTGGLEHDVCKIIEKKSLSNVHLNPLQPYERVGQVYSLGDVCIVSCKAGLGGSAMPSKTWTIMSCGRPVVASFDKGDLQEILENNNCGVFTHAGNVKDFVAAIKQLAINKEKCEVMGKNARRFILDNLTKEVGTKRYVEIIKSVVKK